MTDRIRRAFKMPRRETDETFVNDMRDTRREAVEQSRETLRNIHKLERALETLQEGASAYDEFNKIMFGRTSWSRKGETQP